ncbi:MAG: helix-turn-helix transcriptional regulator [Ruminococcaceae bacterium]|nr:helix-turn-helix transcriptional regulator [Oscillospiraceae bacterium]
METIESNIQRIICEKGLLQKRVAELAGFAPQAFSEMLHGRKTLKAQYIPSIAKALNVTPNEVFGVTGSDECRSA